MSRVLAIAVALLLALHTAWAAARPVHTCCDGAACPDTAMCLSAGCHPGENQAVLDDNGERAVKVPGARPDLGPQIQLAGVVGSAIWRPPPSQNALVISPT